VFITTGYKSLSGTNTPEACIIKLLTAVIYGFRNKLVFVPGDCFQSSLLFRDKH
jgi:hypothetical protein